MKIYCVYDDTIRKNDIITDIIGDNGFGDVVVKKQRLEDYYYQAVSAMFSDNIWRRVRSIFEYEEIIKYLENSLKENTRVLHCFSNWQIADFSKAKLAFEKIYYIDDTMVASANQKVVFALFPDIRTYIDFCKTVLLKHNTVEPVKNIKASFATDAFTDIGDTENFIAFLTGDLDARYFNHLKKTTYTITKTSGNKNKMKAEYTFYHLLPEDMKYWFVMPFNYFETQTEAGYTMERLHMTDLAVKWVHGSIGEKEFSDLMDKYFYFFSCRHKKECSAEEYRSMADKLYVKKVEERIKTLKEHQDYDKIKKLISTGAELDLDNLFNKYLHYKDIIEHKNQYPCLSVIGHGDPCFANTLYNKSTQTLKFIDPKGALNEKDLWTNPYYDIAKLSHSVCGRYDFFNSGLFEIKLSSAFDYELEIPLDNHKYIEIFKAKLQQNGYDYWSVRIYEASLFLSMLPLHIDNPFKVLGFILNARDILKEIEQNV